MEKTPDSDLLHEMIDFVAERRMELEVGAATGAASLAADFRSFGDMGVEAVELH